MIRPMGSTSALALALGLTLSQASAALAQSGSANSAMEGEVRLRQALASQAARQERWQALPQTNPNDHAAPQLRWFSPSQPLHNLTFAWIDEASRNSGMTLAPADAALRAHLGLGKSEGLIVTAVDPGSPAAAAGIHQNDVLLRIGEEESRSVPMARPEDLEKGLKTAGEEPASLVLLRAGSKLTIKVQPRTRVSLGPVHPATPAYWIGVSAAPLEQALRSQLQIPQGQGLMIVEVHKDSPADKARLRPHDIFLRLDSEPLADQTALAKRVQSHGEKPMKIELLRDGKKQEIQVTPERRGLKIQLKVSEPKTSRLDVVLPGAVVAGSEDGRIDRVAEVVGDLELLTTDVRLVNDDAQARSSQAGSTGGKPVEQRLDELSAQLKELRQAIEALAKAQDKK